MAENTEKAVKPIDGPGGGGIEIRGPVRSVARLSSKAKVLLFGAAAVVAGGVVIGTITAGSGSKAQQAEAIASASMNDAVGTVAAPVAPTPVAPAPSATLTPRETEQAQSVQGKTPVDSAASTGLQQGNAAPTPEQQHKEWMEKHRYQRIEGLVLANEAALSADTSKGGAGSLQKLSRSASAHDQDGGQSFDPAQAAAQRYQSSRDKLDRMQADAIDRANMPAGSTRGHTEEDPGPGQAKNKSFLADMKKAESDGYLGEQRQSSLAETSLFAGSVIPAVMLTAINSDLPGTVSAQVRQTVYDSRNPHIVLIPQGSRLSGQYSSDVSYGQKRVLIAWNHMIFPDGSTVNLKGMLGGDGQGKSGFEDDVDNHYIRTFGSAILISMLGVGAQMSQPQNSGALNTAPASAQVTGAVASSLNNTGDRLLNKNLNIQPTLEIRPGYTFNVLANRTIILPPYQ